MKKRTGLGLSIVFMAVLLFISGCNNNNDVQKVYFVDALVVGLEYDCESYTKGKTDKNGAFDYVGIGDCEFHLGELSFTASQESMQKGYVTPYDVTETPEEAYVLSAILHYVSFDAHNHMILLDKATKKINDYPLDRGNESIIGALGIEETDSYIHVDHAQRLLSKYVNSDNTLNYDIFTLTSGTRVTGDDLESGIAEEFATGIARGIGSELGMYAASQIMSSIGIPGFSDDDDFSKVNEKLDKISAGIQVISQKVDTIIGDFDILFAISTIEDQNDFSQMYRDIYDDSVYLFGLMATHLVKEGNVTATLDDYNPSLCAVLKENIFDNTGVLLTSPSTTSGDRVGRTVPASFQRWHDTLIPSLEKYFSAQEEYLSLMMPEIGDSKEVSGFIGLLDQYNESVLQLRLTVMIAVQRLIQLHQTALYLTSQQGIDSTKCSAIDFDDIPQAQSTTGPVYRGHDYNSSLLDLENYYEPFVEELNNYFDTRMISDPIEGKNYTGSMKNDNALWRSAIHSDFTKHQASPEPKHLPDGAWKDSCLIYQYYGFSDLNATVRGDYNGHYLHHAYCKGNDLSPDKYTLSPPFEPDLCNNGGSEAELYKGNLGCVKNGYMQSTLNEPYYGVPYTTNHWAEDIPIYMLQMEVSDNTFTPKFGQEFQAASLLYDENIGALIQNDQNVYKSVYAIGDPSFINDEEYYDHAGIFSFSKQTNENNNSTNISSVSSSRFKIMLWDHFYFYDVMPMGVRESLINIKCLEGDNECHEMESWLLCINNKDLVMLNDSGAAVKSVLSIVDKRVNPSGSLCGDNALGPILRHMGSTGNSEILSRINQSVYK